MANLESIPMVFDSKWRSELKEEILALIKKRHPAIDRGLQFEGVTVDNPTEESLATLLVLQEIVSTMREFSIVQWPGGIALVRTAQVDNLNADYRAVNENANYIIRGGSEKSVDLFENVAKPTAGEE